MYATCVGLTVQSAGYEGSALIHAAYILRGSRLLSGLQLTPAGNLKRTSCGESDLAYVDPELPRVISGSEHSAI